MESSQKDFFAAKAKEYDEEIARQLMLQTLQNVQDLKI